MNIYTNTTPIHTCLRRLSPDQTWVPAVKLKPKSSPNQSPNPTHTNIYPYNIRLLYMDQAQAQTQAQTRVQAIKLKTKPSPRPKPKPNQLYAHTNSIFIFIQTQHQYTLVCDASPGRYPEEHGSIKQTSVFWWYVCINIHILFVSSLLPLHSCWDLQSARSSYWK